MKVLIVGLGLIGGSYAEGLSKKGYTVYGTDINQDAIDFAIKNSFIVDGKKDPTSFIPKVDMIILGLYPTLIIDFLKKYQPLFTKDLLITDVCGVKTSFIEKAIEQALPATYITHHPMAGKEKVGITYASCHIFEGANFLICNCQNAESQIDILKQMALDLGFGRISVITPQYHDKMIGFTSQLAHAIAVSLVNSDTEEDTKNFIGDSYRDLTRIAMINEKLWSELFLENKTYLIDEITNFENQLSLLKKSLLEEDEESLKELFIKSRKKRQEMEK